MAARRKKARKNRSGSRRRKTAKKCPCPAPLKSRGVGLIKSQINALAVELGKRGNKAAAKRVKAAAKSATHDDIAAHYSASTRRGHGRASSVDEHMRSSMRRGAAR